jgi:hypothetical protein
VASRSGRGWSGSEDTLLKTLVFSGNGASYVAQYLSRTTRAIRRRTEVLKISWKVTRENEVPSRKLTKRAPNVSWKAEEDLLVHDMILAGCNESIIAKELGRTIYAVRNRAYKLKLSLKSAII